jgi:hypothetical protein
VNKFGLKKNFREGYDMGDLGIDRKIILKCEVKK